VKEQFNAKKYSDIYFTRKCITCFYNMLFVIAFAFLLLQLIEALSGFSSFLFCNLTCKKGLLLHQIDPV
jgi:hypothetical protein